MEDELMRLFGSDRMSVIIQKLGLKENENIQHPWISKAVENAQKKVEGMNFDLRKQLIDFDNVMNKQREAIYRLRNEILEKEDIIDTIKNMISESIEEKITVWAGGKYAEEWDWISIDAWLLRTFGIKYEIGNKDEINYLTRESVQSVILGKVFEIYEHRKEQFTSELMLNMQRIVFLQMIDSSWRDHLYELDQLKRCIGFRAYAQKDPKIEYQKESFALFESMMKRIRDNTVEYIFKIKIDVKLQKKASQGIISDFRKNDSGKINKSLNKIGRNDLCLCGSGKKFKKCCGA
jgi:preprotein translocase subunit SecA